jgi:hypothetical protein
MGCGLAAAAISTREIIQAKKYFITRMIVIEKFRRPVYPNILILKISSRSQLIPTNKMVAGTKILIHQ